MPSIDKINIKNSFSRQNIKNVLEYAVKNRRGYYNKLRMVDERRGETIDQFKSVGFINTGHTLKSETYSITDSGDEYYRDVFGGYSYWKARLSGIMERFFKRHL
jgi:hypothetical protein